MASLVRGQSSCVATFGRPSSNSNLLDAAGSAGQLPGRHDVLDFMLRRVKPLAASLVGEDLLWNHEFLTDRERGVANQEVLAVDVEAETRDRIVG